MSTDQDIPLDTTRPEELLALAKHLAGDPALSGVFERAGLHETFTHEDYQLVVRSRNQFFPELDTRPATVANTFLAEALARRLFFKDIKSDVEAIEFLEDRIRRVPDSGQIGYDSILYESEIRTIMGNFLRSDLFERFKGYVADKKQTLREDSDIYEGIYFFAVQQGRLYGLGGRGYREIESIIIGFLRNLWFGDIDNLDLPMVDQMMNDPGRYQLYDFLYPDYTPRKG